MTLWEWRNFGNGALSPEGEHTEDAGFRGQTRQAAKKIFAPLEKNGGLEKILPSSPDIFR
jgi:hypothetical protein